MESFARAEAVIGAEDDLRPLVTVVVPVRDAGSLEQLVAPLAAQSLDPNSIEVLIADDGSTDGSAAAVAGRVGELTFAFSRDRP